MLGVNLNQILILILMMGSLACETQLNNSTNSTLTTSTTTTSTVTEESSSLTNHGNSWDLTTAFPGTGKYTGISSAILSSHVCSGKQFLGSATTAICIGPSNAADGDTDAISANVVSGTYYWNATGTSAMGTMVNHSALNLTQDSIPTNSAGHYSVITTALTNSGVCSTKTWLGATGTATCEAPSGGTNSTPNDVLSGTYFWDSSGTSTAGTMINRGSVDASAAFPGSGYYDGTITNLPASNDICYSISILGTAGSANCLNSEILASNAHRDPSGIIDPHFEVFNTSSQLGQSAEVNTYAGSVASPALPTSGGYYYREIPDRTRDDDGYLGTTSKYAPRPTVNCGAAGNISTRILDCATKNGSIATWNSELYGNSGQSNWNLVTRAAANKEVWQDQRTGLIWSSTLSSNTLWCQASGNTQKAPLVVTKTYGTTSSVPMIGSGTIGLMSGGSSMLDETIFITFTSATNFTVTSSSTGCNTINGGAVTSGGLTTTAGSTVTYGRAGYCSLTLTQGSTNFSNGDTIKILSADATKSCYPGDASSIQPSTPVSYCSEGAGFNQTGVSGENWSTGSYQAAKGGMGLNAVNPVSWRLPTRADYLQAVNDGIVYVMPDMGLPGTDRPVPDGSQGQIANEWSATKYSVNAGFGWIFNSSTPYDSNLSFNSTYMVRCVGR